MEPTLTLLEKKVIASLQGDIPVTERPFARLAEAIGITEKQFLQILKGLRDKGIMRRFGATLRHQKSGFEANAMVAWQVDEAAVETVGRTLAGFAEVTHCYCRPAQGDWPYNLYTMIHARDEQGCWELAQKLSAKAGISEYTLLFSRRELKKTSMQYFPDAF